MKFLIASDIHGSSAWCRELVKNVDILKPDRLLLLGDLLYHGPRNDLPKEYAPKEVIAMLSDYKDIIIAVRGNCDAEVDQMVLPFSIMNSTSQIYADDTLFFLTHGHHDSPESLPLISQGSIFLSGHTHVKGDRMINGVRCLNPGSVSIPKDGSNSFLLYENKSFTFHTL